MNRDGVFFLVLIYCSSFSLAAKQNREKEFQQIIVVGGHCEINEKYIYNNYTCYAKSYSRTFSTVNGCGYFKIPMTNVDVRTFTKLLVFSNIFCEQIQGRLLYRYGLVYREVIVTPKVEVCALLHQIVSKEAIGNKVVYAATKFIVDTYPQMIHECPYHVS